MTADTNIDHDDTLDPENLASLAREMAEILDADIPKDDESYDPWLDECVDAKETLQALTDALGELGYGGVDEEDGEAIADAWQNVANNSGSELIAEDYFTEYAKQLVIDVGYLPDDIPDWLVIDWDETADNVKADYSEVTLDGEDYYINLA